MFRNTFFSVVVCLATVNSANSGGLLGDAIEGLCGGCGAGRALDDIHEGIGQPLDLPGQIARETLVETLGPALGQAIRHSRDDARRAGTQPMPRYIRNMLLNFYPADLLNGIEWRVGEGHELSVQSATIRYGDADAVTLIDTIVFRNGNDALYNDALWAHEIFHVKQFKLWGLTDFGKRYVRSHRRVEDDAYAAQRDYESKRDGFQLAIIGSARPGAWLYVGQFDGRWIEKNFNWNGGLLPQPGNKLTARVDINIRKHHIRRNPNNGKWINAAKLGVLDAGQEVTIDRVVDVTNGFGYFWVRISN